ncbi:hypothetical protein BH18ACT15_BH18ACT15_09780 [soil metagenome]
MVGGHLRGQALSRGNQTDARQAIEREEGGRMTKLVAVVRAHRPFALLLVAGAVLRGLAMVAYQPALLLSRDAYVYLRDAHALSFGGLRPALYPVFLKPAVAVHDLTLAVTAQHLMGLGMAVGIYVLCRRLGLGPVLGALSTAPVLLDGYQIQIEQFIMSETLFEALAVAACVLLLWPWRKAVLALPAAAAAGFLIALAFFTRYVGAALLVAAALFFLFSEGPARRRVVSCATLAACFLLPLAAYSLLLETPSGADKIGYPLYGRVAAFVDCKELDLPRADRPLCPKFSPRDGDHHLTIWFSESPLAEIGGTADPRVDGLLRDYALRAIARQPVAYLASVGRDLVRYFEPLPPPVLDSKVSLWLAPRTLDDARPLHRQVERLEASPPPALGFHDRLRIARPAADGLRYYQLIVYTWGPLVAAAALLGLIGAGLGRRSAGGKRALASAGLLCALVVLGLLLARVTLGVYGYRYLIVTIPLVGPAAAMGITIIDSRWSFLRSFRRRRE